MKFFAMRLEYRIMLEIYNEEVRDLLAVDGVQKKYPS